MFHQSSYSLLLLLLIWACYRDFHVRGKTLTCRRYAGTLFLLTIWATVPVDVNRDFHVLGLVVVLIFIWACYRDFHVRGSTLLTCRRYAGTLFLLTIWATVPVDVNMLDLIKFFDLNMKHKQQCQCMVRARNKNKTHYLQMSRHCAHHHTDIEKELTSHVDGLPSGRWYHCESDEDFHGKVHCEGQFEERDMLEWRLLFLWTKCKKVSNIMRPSGSPQTLMYS